MSKTIRDKLKEGQGKLSATKDSVLDTEIKTIKAKSKTALKVIFSVIGFVSLVLIIRFLAEENERVERQKRYAQMQVKVEERKQEREVKMQQQREIDKTWIPEAVSRDNWQIFSRIPFDYKRNSIRHVGAYRTTMSETIAIGESTDKPAVLKIQTMATESNLGVSMSFSGMPSIAKCADIVSVKGQEQVLTNKSLNLDNNLYGYNNDSPLRNVLRTRLESFSVRSDYQGRAYSKGYGSDRVKLLKAGDFLEYRCSNGESYRFSLMGFTKKYNELLEVVKR